jgi:hypothetical protein
MCFKDVIYYVIEENLLYFLNAEQNLLWINFVETALHHVWQPIYVSIKLRYFGNMPEILFVSNVRTVLSYPSKYFEVMLCYTVLPALRKKKLIKYRLFMSEKKRKLLE